MQRHYKTLFTLSRCVGDEAYRSITKTQGINDKGFICATLKVLRVQW